MLAHRRDAADVCVATIPCRRAPCSCCDSRPAGGRTRSLVAIPFLRCASGGIVSELSGGDTPWPAGRTRVTMQSGYIADRVWGSRFITGGRGCLARAAIASCIFWSWRPLPLATDTPAHHGASFFSEPSAATRTPPHATHHVALIGVRGAFRRWVSGLAGGLRRAESPEPPRPSERRRAVASDMPFTRMRCAPGAIRSCGPDAPHVSQRLLSIERATSTPRAPTTLA
jgi:hypothetical protein